MTAVLAAVAVGAALACPAHMLWRIRRGHEHGCLPQRSLADRQAQLAHELEHLRNHRG